VPERLCSACGHAAFDSQGVYCTLFTEHVEETVANECGEFVVEVLNFPTMTMVDGVLAPLVVVPAPKEWVNSEQEREVSIHIRLGYFGKEEQGNQIETELRREIKLRFGDRAEVTRDGDILIKDVVVLPLQQVSALPRGQ
jgi:hypothetical protein